MAWKLAPFASTLSQMKSAAKLGRIVTQPVDEVCECMPRLFNALVQLLCVRYIFGFVDL